MKGKLFLTTIVFLALTGFAAAESTQEIEKTLFIGEEIEIDNYLIEFDLVELEETEQEFKVGYQTDRSLRVLERFRGNEIFESEGDNLNISGEMNITIDYIGSDDDGLYIDLVIDAKDRILGSAEMSSTSPESIAAEQGEDITVPLEIENKGVLNQTFEMNDSTDNSINSYFEFDGYTVSNVEVGPGETETVDLNLEIPEVADPQTKTVEIQGENHSNIKETFELEIMGAERERRISINTNDEFIRDQPGETITANLRVRNEGELALNDIEVDLEGPENWETTVEPEEINTLQPFDSRNVGIEAEIPPNAELGDEFIELSASSDQAEPDDPEEIRVNIAEDSNMTYIGLALMIISLGMLIGVYKKFGRR